MFISKLSLFFLKCSKIVGLTISKTKTCLESCKKPFQTFLIKDLLFEINTYGNKRITKGMFVSRKKKLNFYPFLECVSLLTRCFELFLTISFCMVWLALLFLPYVFISETTSLLKGFGKSFVPLSKYVIGHEMSI